MTQKQLQHKLLLEEIGVKKVLGAGVLPERWWILQKQKREGKLELLERSGSVRLKGRKSSRKWASLGLLLTKNPVKIKVLV